MESSREQVGELAPFVARWALEAGDVATARSLLKTQRTAEGASGEVWRLIADVDIWPDAWLIAAVRRSPPDEQALDALARRHWGVLFGRCQMLTAKREAAADLAQDTWCRVLRARDKLLPGGNFRAYLLMIATNLWRDSKRAALRAGMLAADRMASLEDELVMGDGLSVSLEETLPDLSQLEGVVRDRLKQELDFALGQLGDLSRDVLIARFLDGTSCAEIGRRYGRTEQTASGWLRRALAELKVSLEASRHGAH
ncbi:MAG TPA: sigma-70 family RNA polymerase sigma factor [Opitutaceae bacterium]